MKTWWMTILITGVAVGAAACGDEAGGGAGGAGSGEVDDACESDEDCKDGLECDDHDDESTCQEPHED